MNIIVSSWPASGGSTLALLLSCVLEYEYIYAGGVFKYLSQQTIHDSDGKELVDFEEHVGKEWDILWEAYREYVLATRDNIVFEGKTAGFLQKDKSRVFSIMVTADLETRAGRSINDKRDETIKSLKARDEELQKRWLELFNIDIYSLEAIKANYNFHLDNSNKQVEDEIKNVLVLLHNSKVIDEILYQRALSRLNLILNDYQCFGKNKLKDDLCDQNLLQTPEQIFKEWHEIEALEKPLRDFLDKLSEIKQQ